MNEELTETEEIDLRPSKDTYDAVQSDVTPVSAIKELIDNAIDNWERVYNKSRDLNVDIRYDFDDDIFVIEDNAGGLEEDSIEKLFALGETTKEEIDTPIGAYGVGAKKAIVKIGESAELVSRYDGQEYGYGYTIDEEWLEDSDKWTVTKTPYGDIESGKTRITISGLKMKVGDLVDEFGDEVEEGSYSEDEFLHLVKSDLSETYEDYLEDDGTFSGDLNIYFNEERIGPPEPINWSFTPFDGFYPRTYKDITLQRHNLDHPVYLDITVGLRTVGNQDTAGTDIFCQSRKVISSDDSVVGGYGRDDLRVGELSATNSRLRVIMRFRTKGDADRLPWNTQKNGIDQYDSLMQEAYEDWFDKIVYPYWQASSYDKMAKAFLRPYSSDTPYAANGGTIRRYDYRGRTRLSDRPNRDMDDVERLEETLNSHLEMGIYAPQTIAEDFRPAYELAIEESDKPAVLLDELPAGLEGSELSSILRGVRTVARQDVTNGVRRASSEWCAPLYNSIIEGKLEDGVTLEEIDEPILDSEETSTNPVDESDTGVSTGKQSTVTDSTTDSGKRESSKGVNDTESDETEKDRKSSTTNAEADSENPPENQDQDTSSGDGNQEGADSPMGHQENDGTRPAVLKFSEAQRDRLLEYLELPSDTDEEIFREKLKAAILSEFIEEEDI